MKVFNKVFAVLMAFSVLVLTGTPVLAAESVANATVTGVQYEVEETGSAITFPITVKLGDKQLQEDTDYTVTYSNNTAAGQASLKITGIGAYEGEQLIAFTITAKEEAADTPAEDATADEEDEEEVAEDEDDTSKDSSDSKKEKDTEAEAKLDASDDSSKTPAKVDTTETANTDSGSNNSTTKDSTANVTKSTVKKSPKTGDYNNGLLISFATLSVLLLAGGAYYIHLKRA